MQASGPTLPCRAKLPAKHPVTECCHSSTCWSCSGAAFSGLRSLTGLTTTLLPCQVRLDQLSARLGEAQAGFAGGAGGYTKPKGDGGSSAADASEGRGEDPWFVEFQWAAYLRRKLQPPLPAEPDNQLVGPKPWVATVSSLVLSSLTAWHPEGMDQNCHCVRANQ